jgi:hypothetical protein
VTWALEDIDETMTAELKAKTSREAKKTGGEAPLPQKPAEKSPENT